MECVQGLRSSCRVGEEGWVGERGYEKLGIPLYYSLEAILVFQ